jgi:hypothetical protein
LILLAHNFLQKVVTVYRPIRSTGRIEQKHRIGRYTDHISGPILWRRLDVVFELAGEGAAMEGLAGYVNGFGMSR